MHAERGEVPHCKGVTRQGAAVGHVKLVCPDWANAVPAHIKIKNNSRFIISASRAIEDACGRSCCSGMKCVERNGCSEMARTGFYDLLIAVRAELHERILLTGGIRVCLPVYEAAPECDELAKDLMAAASSFCTSKILCSMLLCSISSIFALGLQ